MIPFLILAIENDDDRDFMEHLYLEYNSLMYSEANKIVGSQWDAEEVVQTVVEKLINHIDKLRALPRDNRVNYIITAVVNCSLDCVSKGKSLVFTDIDTECAEIAEEYPHLDDALLTEANKATLFAAWQRLSEKDRYLLRSKYILDMPNGQIAEALGIKPDSVRTLLTRARNALRKEFLKLDK